MTARDAIWNEVERHYSLRPDGAAACRLGDQVIVKPDGAIVAAPALYIMGFNGGEPRSAAPVATPRPSRSASNWFALCERAAAAVGVGAWCITEQCHWGSPDIATLKRRIGSRTAYRDLLRLHAKANQDLFAETPPLLVWMTGFAALGELIEDYGLRECAPVTMREGARRGVHWREFVDGEGTTPWMVSRHPTGARAAAGEHDRLLARLGSLAHIPAHV